MTKQEQAILEEEIADDIRDVRLALKDLGKKLQQLAQEYHSYQYLNHSKSR